MNEKINEVKKKKEFSQLPDSIVQRALEISKGDVKEARAFLRKYFGVFLTNHVMKANNEEVLGQHISSKKRNYVEFYREIFLEEEKVGSIIDLGCGVNGFSYKNLQRILGEVNYLGVEASGQIVRSTNEYFKKENLNAEILQEDLFNLNRIIGLLNARKRPRFVFMLQLIDALENFERNFSKKFILEISKECEKIVLSLPTESLGGRRKFVVQRKWFTDFLEEHFVIEKDFCSNGERIFVIRRN